MRYLAQAARSLVLLLPPWLPAWRRRAGGRVRRSVCGGGNVHEWDAARQVLLNPALLALFGNIQGQRFLDAGCGTGYLCRLLSRQGASVVGLEPAQALYAYAAQREQDERLGITYVQQDLSLLEDYREAFNVVVAKWS